MASKRYREDLEKKKENDQKIEISRKRKILNDELLTVNKKKLDEKVLLKKMKDAADRFIEQSAQDGGVEIAGCEGTILQKIRQGERKSNRYYKQNDGEYRKGTKSLEVKLQNNINFMI